MPILATISKSYFYLIWQNPLLVSSPGDQNWLTSDDITNPDEATSWYKNNENHVDVSELLQLDGFISR